MSGIQARLRYDTAASQQFVDQSTREYRDYDFLVDKFENRPNTTQCNRTDPHIECKSCSSNQNILDNTRDASLAYRIDMENDLRGSTRPLTLADSGKYISCNLKSTGACDSQKPIANPWLCDRNIVPTNMRPFTSPMSY